MNSDSGYDGYKKGATINTFTVCEISKTMHSGICKY